MKKSNLYILFFSIILLFSSCTALQKTTQGAYAGIEREKTIIGKDGNSTIVGAKPTEIFEKNSATYRQISKEFDKVAEEIAYVDISKVESFSDANHLKALKVSFESDDLFESKAKISLKEEAKQALSELAKILKSKPSLEILVLGHSDNEGTLTENEKYSVKIAKAAANSLKSNGVNKKQIKAVVGRNFIEPIASNETEAGRVKNRRVEILIYANKQMIASSNE